MPNHLSTTGSPKARNSSLELLRILAMLLIVLSHACKHSRFAGFPSGMSWNRLFVQWGQLGHVGSGLFMLISGYYLCKKQNHYRSLIRLFLQVWFYSVAIFAICRFGLGYSYSLYEYCEVFFPTIFQEYWFFTAYAVIILLCPYINFFLEKATRETLGNLILVMFLLWVLIPTLTLQSIFGSGLVQMTFYYIVGAYFRLYPDHTLKKKHLVTGYTAASFVLLFASNTVLDFLGQYMEPFQNKGDLFYSKESLLIVMSAIGLFSCFVKRKPFYSRIVDTIASCTFGVYLIHDNPAVRNILWLQFFRHAEHADSCWLTVHILISVGIVFCVCAVIEYLRSRILGKSFDEMAGYLAKKAGNVISSQNFPRLSDKL